MGCDIHTRCFGSNREPLTIVPQAFDCRSYRLFGFLADVRNYSGTKPISAPRGLPSWAEIVQPGEDEDFWYNGERCHSHTWFSVRELLDFDYDLYTENRRHEAEVAPGYVRGDLTCETGSGEILTLRDFLGCWYFEELDRLKRLGVAYIAICFDN